MAIQTTDKLHPAHRAETRALQSVVAVLALTPVLTGLAGTLAGPTFLGLDGSWPTDLDSHFRFLSGVFLAIGVAWLCCVPDIGRKTSLFRLLAVFTFAGGLARLLSLGVSGLPGPGHLAGLAIELLVVPALVWWQARVGRFARSADVS